MDRIETPFALPPVPWLAIGAVTATVSVFAIAQGLSYPLLAFILERQGVSPTMIGLSAAMSPLGMMVASSFVPRLVNWLGGVRTVLICSIFCAAMFALIGATQNVWLWFPLRFLLGFSVIPLYVLSEVWMIALAPAYARGRFMGVYTSIISLGFALGPATLALVGTQGWAPFLVGIAAFLVCGLFVFAVAARLPAFHEDEQQGTVRRFLPVAPTLLLAVVVAAGFETAMMSLLPSYGRAFAIGEAQMATLLTVFIVGNFALQVPLGLLADRWNARGVMLLCAVMGIVGCVLLPIVLGTPAQWPVAFFWGAFAYGIYTMAIVELGQRFTGSMLVAGNAAFALMWGIGGISGPPSAGVAMQAIGANGLPLILASLCLVLVVVALFRARQRSA
ncbi:MFS transporter [Aliihoeflea aestuarii]|uniref:MFS transporter n=1 Tax=Aliihoeflea aestuarii TaxID=453840 RepID=UPI002092BFED|nr:MFS transporter [Aliihoeflea aestuarii]MCO6391974.1 MFS transporter [Aliihoeflea aestuarii]